MNNFIVIEGGRSRKSRQDEIKVHLTRIKQEPNPGKLTLKQKRIRELMRSTKPKYQGTYNIGELLLRLQNKPDPDGLSPVDREIWEILQEVEPKEVERVPIDCNEEYIETFMEVFKCGRKRAKELLRQAGLVIEQYAYDSVMFGEKEARKIWRRKRQARSKAQI